MSVTAVGAATTSARRPTIFSGRLDHESVDGEVEKLGPQDLRSVTDLCYQRKLCFNHCPYTPPHRWEVDFPRLMMKSKAIDGTWGLKQQYFDLSVKVAQPLLREVRERQPDWIVSDCPLAGLQIQQGIGRKSLHPVQLLAAAYGLEEGE